MKKYSLNFCRRCLFSLAVMAMAVCLWACAGTPQSEDKKPADVKQQSVETRSTTTSPSPSTSTRQTSPSSPATAPQVKPAESDIAYLVITAKTSLRAEPKSKAKVITKLKKGEKVLRLNASDSWYQVELSDQTTGWVLKKYTKEE